MSIYLTVKSIAMTIALSGAFYLFYVRINRRFKLMTAVTGQSGAHLWRPGAPVWPRIKETSLEVLGQREVRRKTGPGWAHTLIFYGFLAVQPHSLELMISGICPAFDPVSFLPGLWPAYLYLADLTAPLVLVGLAYALYRRTIIRPPYLTAGQEALWIIGFTGLIILTFIMINGLTQFLPQDRFSHGSRFPLSATLAPLLGVDRLGPETIRILWEICYFIHMGTILGFLVYIPGSKHLHLAAAVPNVFFKPMKREKAMVPADLEDETAESFGLGNISELSWKGVLDLYACTECGRCEEQCPAAFTQKPLSPKAVIHDLKEELLGHGDLILDGKGAKIPPLIREKARIEPDAIWSCTTCRACEDICPVHIQHLDPILEIRRHQVLMAADFPPEMTETFTSLEHQGNPWGFSPDERTRWCTGLEVPLMTDTPDADILWFVGCAGAFDHRGKLASQAMAGILKKAGLSFAILGPEETCNGDAARRAGNEYLAQVLIQQNVALFNRYRPRQILTGCPHCYNMIRNEYPDFGAAYPVISHLELIQALLDGNRLRVSTPAQEQIILHDSCYFGRWNGIFEAPRQIIQRISSRPGPVEPVQSRDKGFCCGAGGARMFMEEHLGRRINHERVAQLTASGADIVATACPFCATMISDGIRDMESHSCVEDIVRLVDRATDPA